MATPVKVEMTEYSTMIQSALDSSLTDTSCLEEKIGSICVKDDLDVIIKNIDKSNSSFKATVASILAKRQNPDWDTRKHQTQIGGKYSLRTIDASYVSDYLFKNGYYNTVTAFGLTRSFEKAEPFMQTYSGNISPKECKSAFLNLVEVINTSASEKLLNDMLVYLMSFLKERKAKNTTLNDSIVDSSNDLTLEDISIVMEKINALGSGIAVVPVIITHTLLCVIQPYMFDGVSMKNLKEHTAPDNHSHSYGDVEGFDTDSIPVIAIEVKHKIAITESIIMTFDKKTIERKIPYKFILTTAKTSKVWKNNICIDTVSGFTASHLQYAMRFEPNICLLFIKELRSRIVTYHNISTEMKESINELLTSLLVSPSL